MPSLLRRRHHSWRAALSARLHSRDAGARIADTASDTVRDPAEQSGLLDFSLLLPDVMTIADEVDAQLTQSMDSYMNAMRKSAAA